MTRANHKMSVEITFLPGDVIQSQYDNVPAYHGIDGDFVGHIARRDCFALTRCFEGAPVTRCGAVWVDLYEMATFIFDHR